MANLFSFIPLSIAILFAIKVPVIYLLAAYYEHVNPLFPFLGDSGTTHPEAGFFSMFLILEGILILMFGWIRFKQIRYILSTNSGFYTNNNSLKENQIKRIKKFNNYGLYSAIMLGIGLEMGAAFRSTEHLAIHSLATVPSFLGFCFLFYIQTWISYKLKPSVNTKRMAVFRLVFAIISLILVLVMSVAIVASVAQIKVPLQELLGEVRLKWDESHGGYIAHYIGAISQNVFLLMAIPFFGSFFTEFKRINSHKGRLKYNFITQSKSTPV